MCQTVISQMYKDLLCVESTLAHLDGPPPTALTPEEGKVIILHFNNSYCSKTYKTQKYLRA